MNYSTAIAPYFFTISNIVKDNKRIVDSKLLVNFSFILLKQFFEIRYKDFEIDQYVFIQ